MNKYHIFKQTKMYEGKPYYTDSFAPSPLEFNSIKLAIAVASYMRILNPSGWNIWDASTSRLIDGIDIFSKGDLK